MSLLLQRLYVPLPTWLFIFGHGGKFLVSVSPATGAPLRSGSIGGHAFPHIVEDFK